MRTTRAVAVTLTVFLFNAPAPAADETPAKGKIVAVDLFKNGLAVVKCEVTLAKSGAYVLDEVPAPVHGTFWIDSPTPVEVVTKMRDVEVPASEVAPGNLQDDLAGKKVTVYFKGGNRQPVVGTMMKLKPAKNEDTTATTLRVYGAAEPPPSRFLVLETVNASKGRVYIDASEVATVEAEDAGNKVIRQRPRLLLTLADGAKADTKVTLRYLTHGISWAPSYRIDISDPRTLALEQHATIKNELADLSDAEVRLISGYPSVQYAHVRSLISPRVNWAIFFAELGSSQWREIDALSNSVVTQQVVGNPRVPSGVALGATPTGEGVDLHYQPIGKRTLAEGDALAIVVARGKADYERIVEWIVPDTRDENGYARDRGRGGNGNDDDSTPWDALKFKNPLPFAMTTGPASVTANGQFNGQRTSYWVNAGEEMILRIEKALSIRTRATENEIVNKDGSLREIVWVGGRQYRRSTVAGELAISNHRKETIPVVIRRRFSGELVSADGSPTTSLREEGVFSINRRNELLWTVSLKPGEERKFKYTYTVLVPH
jgi:hypothetical protein